jgi:quinol-cytochrome oxidoreductase complex cytochrome b subunit
MPKVVEWFDDRYQLTGRLRKNFTDKNVPVHATKFWYCFGGLTLLSFMIQVATGAFLLLYYDPDADRAYQSIYYITNIVPYGWFLRGLHFFGANAMLAMVILHTLRVFYTGSYRKPRELTWVTGVLALLLTMAMGLTGYLLKWDQTAYWGMVAISNLMKYVPVVGAPASSIILGGDKVSAATLTRFFAFHIALVPATLIVFLIGHFWMIRKQGIARPL